MPEQKPASPQQTVLSEHLKSDGRVAQDVVAAILVDWLHGLATTATLRVIAEELCEQLVEHGFAIVPIENIGLIADDLGMVR